MYTRRKASRDEADIEYGEKRRSAFDSHGRLSVAGAKDGAKETDEVNA
jgi:hypothetical protein